MIYLFGKKKLEQTESASNKSFKQKRAEEWFKTSQLNPSHSNILASGELSVELVQVLE